MQSKFSLHSPFIYKFWAGILKDKTQYPAFTKTEGFRKELLNDKSTINRLDFGAGSNEYGPGTGTIKVKNLARRSLISAAEGRFLYKLVKEQKAVSILEFGTSLGLSALYMAEAAPDARIITMEGCPETAALARRAFDKSGKKNITVLTGAFDVKLREALGLMPKPDLVFFDGNHRKGPTLKYWEECKPHLNASSVVVFDDIHWSGEMEEAWKFIIAEPEVRVSIDLFHLGVVYFREELSKEDFVLRF
ncbi:MAG: class I SAM-dependent methyltransferase [Bacteroidetes bacterium]|nr:class I SAM-dependent methyltransferase [Bacteroidota bacterium]